MPKRLTLSPKDKRDLRRRYARGETATDLVVSRKDLGLSLTQVQNLICREGWARQRGQIAEAKRRAADEVLSTVRADTAEDLEKALRSVQSGFANDAAHLETAFPVLVDDAAGASALQRARLLNLTGLLRFFGLDKADSRAPARANIAVVFGRFPEASPGAAPNELAAEPAEVDLCDDEGLELKFETDETTDRDDAARD